MHLPVEKILPNWAELKKKERGTLARKPRNILLLVARYPSHLPFWIHTVISIYQVESTATDRVSNCGRLRSLTLTREAEFTIKPNALVKILVPV